MSLPALAIDGIELPRLPDIVHQPAGHDHVEIDGKLGIGGPHLLGDPDREKANRALQAMLKMKKIIVADLDQAAAS